MQLIKSYDIIQYSCIQYLIIKTMKFLYKIFAASYHVDRDCSRATFQLICRPSLDHIDAPPQQLDSAYVLDIQFTAMDTFAVLLRVGKLRVVGFYKISNLNSSEEEKKPLQFFGSGYNNPFDIFTRHSSDIFTSFDNDPDAESGGMEIDVMKREEAIRKHYLRRIFFPGRFSFETIEAVIAHDVPCNLDIGRFVSMKMDFGELVRAVLVTCDMWSQSFLNDDFALEKCFNHFLKRCEARESLRLSATERSTDCLIRTNGSKFYSRGSVKALVVGKNRSVGIIFGTGSDDHSEANTACTDDNSSSNFATCALLFERIEGLLQLHQKSLDELFDFMQNYFFEHDDLSDSNHRMITSVIEEALVSTMGVEMNNVLSSSLGSNVSIDFLDTMLQFASLSDMDFTNKRPSSSSSSPTSPSVVASTAFSILMKGYITHKQRMGFVAAIISLHLLRSKGIGTENLESIDMTESSRVATYYFPSAINMIIYSSFLLWLDSILPLRSSETIERIEIFDLCPNSNISPLKRNLFSGNFTPKFSLLTNFWHTHGASYVMRMIGKSESSNSFDLKLPRNFVSHPSMEAAKNALCPSFSSSLVEFLLEAGEFSSLRRLLSLLQQFNYVKKSGIANHKDEICTSRFLNVIGENKLSTLKSFCNLLDTLRWHQNHVDGDGSVAPADMQPYENLLGIEACVEELLNSWSLDSRDEDICEDIRSIEKISYPINHLNIFLTSLADSENCPSSCLDTFRKVALQPFFLCLIDPEKCTTEYILESLIRKPHLHLEMVRISYFSDILELLLRIRILFPPSFGAKLALRAGKTLIDMLKRCLGFFEVTYQNDDKQVICSLIKDHIDKSYDQIFDISLEGHFFDEALDAARNLQFNRSATTFNNDSHEMSTSMSNLSYVHASSRCHLRELVVCVCESGQLGWLCSNFQLFSDVDIKKQIGSELERKAFKGSLQDFVSCIDITSTSFNVVYFECLCAYLLRQNNYRNAANVMDSFSRKIEVELKNIYNREKGKCLGLSVATLALEVTMNPNQAFVIRSGDDEIRSRHQLSFDLEKASALIAAATFTNKKFTSDSNTAIIESLCEEGEFFRAITLSSLLLTHCKDLSSEREKLKLMENVIESLSRLIAGNIDFPVANGSKEANVSIHFSSCLSEAARPWKSSVSLYMDILLELLSNVGCISQKWLLHKVAGLSFMQCRPGCRLPESLVESYCGFNFCRKNISDNRIVSFANNNRPSNVTLREGDPVALIRLLFQYGHLYEACDICSRALEKMHIDYNHYRQQLPITIKYIPIDLIDSLLSACDLLLGGSSIIVDELYRAKQRLERRVHMHFYNVFQEEKIVFSLQ